MSLPKEKLIWDSKIKLKLKEPKITAKLNEINARRVLGTPARMLDRDQVVGDYYKVPLEDLEELVSEYKKLQEEASKQTTLGAEVMLLQYGWSFNFIYRTARGPSLAEIASENQKKEKKLNQARKRIEAAQKLVKELEQELGFKEE